MDTKQSVTMGTAEASAGDTIKHKQSWRCVVISWSAFMTALSASVLAVPNINCINVWPGSSGVKDLIFNQGVGLDP